MRTVFNFFFKCTLKKQKEFNKTCFLSGLELVFSTFKDIRMVCIIINKPKYIFKKVPLFNAYISFPLLFYFYYSYYSFCSLIILIHT